MRGSIVVVAASLACIGCGKSWVDVAKEQAPSLEPIRAALPKVKALIDGHLDAGAFPTCAPSKAITAENTAFLDYTRLSNGGLPDREHLDSRQFEIAFDGALAQALYWTSPDVKYSESTAFSPRFHAGFPEKKPRPEDLDVIKRAAGTKNIVVVRERDGGSHNTNIMADAYVVTLEPMAIACTIVGVSSKGHKAGTEPKKYLEITYNKKTGKTLKEREFTEGGYYTSDASYEANKAFSKYAIVKLGFSPQTKDDEDDVKSAPQHVAAMEEAYKTLLVQAWSILEKHRAEAAACAKKAKGEAALCDYELVHKLEADPECKLQEEDLRLFFEPFRARVGGAPSSAAAGAKNQSPCFVYYYDFAKHPARRMDHQGRAENRFQPDAHGTRRLALPPRYVQGSRARAGRVFEEVIATAYVAVCADRMERSRCGGPRADYLAFHEWGRGARRDFSGRRARRALVSENG